MTDTIPLNSVLPYKGITIISGYTGTRINAYVAGYRIKGEDQFNLLFPKGHSFCKGQRITMHLDNRTGVEDYDSDLRVYRCSYKGIIISATEREAVVAPEEYMLFYSDRCVNKYVAPDYRYEKEPSTGNRLPLSDLKTLQNRWNSKEQENKLGVLITGMTTRPHTSLMAFISDDDDDVFLITFKGTFKSRVLHSNNRCCFAIDHRSEYNFEKAIDWNYTIIDAEAFEIPPESPVFDQIKHSFVEKNPWEISFFLSPEIEMFHLKQRGLIIPGCLDF